MKNTQEYLDLLALTGIPDAEMYEILKKSTISIESFKEFYAMSGRMPTAAEEDLINSLGFNYVHKMHMNYKGHDVYKVMNLLSLEISKKKTFYQKIKDFFKSWL